MYSVTKNGNRIVISDWKGVVVYSADGDAIIVYDSFGTVTTSRVKALSDEQLLMALTTARKLPL